MKIIKFIVLGMLISFSYNCKFNQKEKESNDGMEDTTKKEVAQVKSIQVSMEPKSGSKVEGVVNFSEEDGAVTMTATLKGLTEGEHAIHIHEKADCSAADGTSAGGHWNPTGEPHGKWGAESGYHRGDIGNIMADADGNATITFSTGEWCIGCDDSSRNIVGKSVIVHQGADDFTTQPSGDAGARVACTGIIQ